MTFSYTGVAYLLSFLGIGLLSYRFFQYWQREKTTTSRLFFYFALFFALFTFTTAIPSLFFSQDTHILRWVVILAATIQIFPLSIVGYLIIYLRFPRISPWLGFATIFLLGLGSAIFTIIIPFQPYLEVGGGINWDIPPIVNYIRSVIFSVTFLPLFFILIQQTKASREPFVKARALGLGIGIGFGAIAGLFDFFLEPTFNLPAISSDIAMAAISIIVIMTILFTKQVPAPQKEEKYIPPSPQIQW